MPLFDIEKTGIQAALQNTNIDFKLYKAKDGTYLFGRPGDDGGIKAIKLKNAFKTIKGTLKDDLYKRLGSPKAVKALVNLIDHYAREKEDDYIDTVEICRRVFPPEQQ